MTAESREIRLKRLKMRSWRRGMKEMDLILGPFSDDALQFLSENDFDIYEALLEENDQELYTWFSGANPTPKNFTHIVQHIKVNSPIR